MHQAEWEELVVFWKAVMRGKRACPVWEDSYGIFKSWASEVVAQ